MAQDYIYSKGSILNPAYASSGVPINPADDVKGNEIILGRILDIGEAMLYVGADVNLVERSIVKMGFAYGAAMMNTLVITTSIVATMTLPHGEEFTLTRRTNTGGGVDFRRLEQLNNLVKFCTQETPDSTVIAERLNAIANESAKPWKLYLGSMLASSGFAIFFGGNFLDGAIAMLIGVLIAFMLQFVRPITPNNVVFNFLAALISGIIIAAVALVLPINAAFVMIGDIMLLIPGLAMTNAVRDVLAGDTISGVMRLVESLLWASAIALGFMVSITIFNMIPYNGGVTQSALLQFVFVGIGTLGFGLLWNMRTGLLLQATLGGILTWGLFYGIQLILGGIFLPALYASIFAAVYARVASVVYKAPTIMFYILSVIPLIPGSGLFYTMRSAVLEDMSRAQSYAATTGEYALAIACGIFIVWMIVEMYRRIKTKLKHASHTPHLTAFETTQAEDSDM
ncbi:MAG: threonine/serine exporter family protein [Eggerthellaceae bacterium]|nr:threonine/serine exporter family protein [Eggerthellaceae bacterium]